MSRSSGVETRWAVRRPGEVSWIDLDEAFVVFHRPSGKTHFLNVSSRLLLTEILTRPVDVDLIVTALEQKSGIAPDESTAGHVIALLERFEHLGLVERL